LVALYTNMLWYFELSRSLSLVLPVFSIHDAGSAEAIGVAADKPFTWDEMMRHRPAYLKLVKPILDMKTMNAREDELLQIGLLMQHMEVDKETRVLRVMPPLWGNDSDTWLSPWAVVQEGQGSPQSVSLLAAWRKAGEAWRSGDPMAWNTASAELLKQTMAEAQDARPTALKAEYLYNRADFFTFSLVLYVGAFLALLAVGAGGPIMFYRASFGLLAFGAVLHFIGLSLRIYIMDRPPVGTLYESILFVGLVAVIGGLFIEWRTRQGLGLVLGVLTGTVLQFIGLKYAGEGDSMGMLVAVLNTNFWLATHVVAITIAYGCCIVAGLLAHLWLLQKVATPDERLRLELTAKSMLGAALVALLFAMTGTILGGIWADQSWGRFWGWDPKENGALLIVLWLLWLLHGRLSGLLTPVRFALGLALTTVVVALSWFGVNLLGVGLHSYGFTTGIALNLGLFVAVEAAIIGGLGLTLRQREGAAA
jgi:ABC-type transport system involved in cytochrome c biogenesis permease subunit